MTKTRGSASTPSATLDAELPALDTASPTMMFGLQDLRHRIAVECIAVAADAMEFRTLSVAKAYAFASVDFPGAAWSFALDTNGVTTVGYFVIDPSVNPLEARAFTFSGGAYQILSVPNSVTSYGAGINSSGMIVGIYQNLSGKTIGYVKSGGTFSDVEYPGAAVTQAVGINDSGVVVGAYTDATGSQHGFRYGGGTFTAIDFPEPPAPPSPGSTRAATSSAITSTRIPPTGSR